MQRVCSFFSNCYSSFRVCNSNRLCASTKANTERTRATCRSKMFTLKPLPNLIEAWAGQKSFKKKGAGFRFVDV